MAFVRHIQVAGVRLNWPASPAKPLYRNQYLLLEGWKYWTMGDPHPGVIPPIETPETTTLVNRARIEPQQEGLSLVHHGRLTTSLPVHNPDLELQAQGGARNEAMHGRRRSS